ncbi:hypothetical protein KR222_000515, partial [Zaprionus bogoriensis]
LRAETKKRRASVYSNENLFIPKELARGELYQRRHCSTLNTLDPISGNRDYCIRMLKFPVGSGRARFVAQQLRRRKKRERKTREELTGNAPPTELSVKRESSERVLAPPPLSMPNLNTEAVDGNQLYSDDECSVVLEQLTMPESEEADGTDELIERLSKRQLRRASSLDSKCNGTELSTGRQEQLQLFRWHNPDYSDNSIKMGAMADMQQLSLSAPAEIHVSYTDVEAIVAIVEETQQPTEAALATREIVEEPATEPQQHLPNVAERTHETNPVATEQQQQQHQPLVTASIPDAQQHVAEIPYLPHTTTTATFTSHTQVDPQYTELPLRQELIQHIMLQPLHAVDYVQPHNASNIVARQVNLQEHFGDTLLPSELRGQWTKQHYEKYACPRAAAQQQHLAERLQQQQFWPMAQAHYEVSCQEQRFEQGQGELQQLNAQYQRLKYQQDEQLKSINKTLKDVHANRLLSERQHAAYHRMFMHKMVESKKEEEHLQTQKLHLKRKLKAELSHLQQRINEKQRQLHEHVSSWQWQQQQQQQQQQKQQQQQLAFSHHQQQQQQHFLRQLQPPAYQPRLQCFQDAFSQYTDAHLMPPCGAVEVQHQLMLPPQAPSPAAPPAVVHSSELSEGCGHSMRRRHKIDHRANPLLPYQPMDGLMHVPAPRTHAAGYGHARATSDSTPAIHHFALPETPVRSLEQAQVNQAIEQTAITSIISNYVTNYLNDMESRDP